jgi:hypothetical protein
VEKTGSFHGKKTVPAKIVFAGRKKPPGKIPAKLVCKHLPGGKNRFATGN